MDLIKACSQYSSLRLSDVFLNWKDKFLVYADYCANLTTAQDRIQDICNQNEHINREVNVRLNILEFIIHILLYLYTFNKTY